MLDLDRIKRRLAREEKTYGDPIEAMVDDLHALVAEVESLRAERDAAVARVSELEQQRDEMADAAQAEQAARHEAESLLDRARGVLRAWPSQVFEAQLRFGTGRDSETDRFIIALADLLSPTTETEGNDD